MSSFDVDVVIQVLSRTLFSPSFCVLLSLTIFSQVKDPHHPAFIGVTAWTGLVCAFSLLRHVNRIYASQGSWLFAPPGINWSDQVVLITGGGSGIGALLAETLAMRNITVVVLTKDKPTYEVENDNIVTYLCDVSDYEQVEATATKVREEVGEPTIIVNNAGVVKGKLLLDLSKEDIQEQVVCSGPTFGVNTLAHFWVQKAFLPALVRMKRGHIVSISSILGLVGAAQMTDYCASKAALVSLHQTLRYELDSRHKTPGIRTTLVLPSFTLTSLFAKAHMPRSALFQFLAPPLQPHVIVKQIIDALDAEESRVIRLPWYSNVARFMGPAVGIVPKWLGDCCLRELRLMKQVSGADFAMKEYGPSPDAAERIASEAANESAT
ncbi:hypothetical protein DB88DRAFT_468999 [Papiliotrema laurentii]|uniref:Short-chain dehydrogenase/reductase 3 n=1 Tax=Papiliotrema laurentii TaxID=5418 RepID=A0AAD9FMF7_PAPLA|nr:hypothetical protein DB88DRAFT_468999 [Papiliotrema laurentii]